MKHQYHKKQNIKLGKVIQFITNIMFLDIIHRRLYLNAILFIFQNTTLRRLDSVSVFG
jgi:hypothetical protein